MLITDPGRLIASFTWEESTFSTSASIQTLLPEDKYRMGFIVQPSTGANINISTSGDVTQGTGFRIQGALAPFAIYYRDMGAVVGAEWFLAANFMAQNGTILIARFDPRNQRV